MTWIVVLGILFFSLVGFSVWVYIFVEPESKRTVTVGSLSRMEDQSHPEVSQKILEIF